MTRLRISRSVVASTACALLLGSLGFTTSATADVINAVRLGDPRDLNVSPVGDGTFNDGNKSTNVGAVGSGEGVDLAGVHIFDISDVPDSYVFTEATLSMFYAGPYAGPQFNVDLYGLGFGNDPSPNGGDFGTDDYYAGAFGGDPNATPLHDDILVPTSATAVTITTTGSVGTGASSLLADDGRHIEPLSEAIRSVCADRSWVLPAHDTDAATFHGQVEQIDLVSASAAHNLTLVARLLGARLDPSLVAQIRGEVTRRVVEPMFRLIRDPNLIREDRRFWWAAAPMNWNAVCTAGALGAILGTVVSRAERARAILAAEENADCFLSGFSADGYCSEGIGYWNYGFGHFLLLAELVHQHTGGAMDLLNREAARVAGRFPLQMQIAEGVYPAFSDVGDINPQPEPFLLRFVRRRLLHEPDADWPFAEGLIDAQRGFYELAMRACPTSASEASSPSPADATATLPPRSYFPDAGVLIARPAGGRGQTGLGAAIKAGHNREHHNHNDVGSYVIVCGGEPVILDPGGMEYTASTFGAQRYTFHLMSSFGHAVPVVSGELQSPGPEARGRIVQTEFTDARDVLAADLTACYPTRGLRRLVRTWHYDRAEPGGLEVVDAFELEAPGTFETAVVGQPRWWQLDAHTLAVAGERGALRVEIEASAAVTWDAVHITNPGRFEPVRVGVRFVQPVAAGWIALRFRPMPIADLNDAAPLSIRRIPSQATQASPASPR